MSKICVGIHIALWCYTGGGKDKKKEVNAKEQQMCMLNILKYETDQLKKKNQYAHKQNQQTPKQNKRSWLQNQQSFIETTLNGVQVSIRRRASSVNNYTYLTSLSQKKFNWHYHSLAPLSKAKSKIMKLMATVSGVRPLGRIFIGIQ